MKPNPVHGTPPRVTADAPYPPLEVEGPNRQIARMLSFSLASDKSEMTSITQYMYQSWALSPSHAEWARTMERIAEVEMRHFQILGRLILQLGGDPRYAAPRRNRLVFWNGSMPSYNRTPQAILLDSLHLEEAAIETYRRQITLISDECVSLVLKRIILDEEIHARLFERCLQEL